MFPFMRRPPKTDSSPDLRAHIERLRRSRRHAGSLKRVEHIPARPARWGDWPGWVEPWLRDALAGRGTERPYSHQAAAWENVAAHRHCVVVTPTASGKTLCYNVPVLSMLRADPAGTALYLYPTKALAQDQCAELNALLDLAGLDETAHVYDGDTPADLRRRVRDVTRLILTNPDMLHRSVLPNHEQWGRVFRSLRYVIIDEMHAYRGVFGSHVANVIRRLRRVLRYYGADPVFVLASATIANPAELGERLLGEPVAVVDQSGAPSGERYFVLYNPPLLDTELQRRQSPGAAAQHLVAPLLEAGHSAIVFARSRQGVEILTRRLRESLEAKRQGELARRVEGYRAGYLPEERRRIERGLREGQVRAVISTNALELGIDIGALDVCVIAAYPGTIASTWQQAGRAGRRSGTSLCVLVAGDEAVDQFLVNNPDYFFGASPEHGRIDPDNLRILAEHLKCAAFELPVATDESFGTFGVDGTQEVLGWLHDEAGIVHVEDGLWRWNGQGYPAQAISLRDIHDENFVIVDATAAKHTVLGEVDFEAAHTTIYENAIYQHGGVLHEVQRLDYPERKAYVRRVEPEYFTQAIDQTRIFVLDPFEERPAEGRAGGAGWGEIRVTKRFVGYKKIRFRTWENIGYGEIHLPDLEKHTTSYWCVVPAALTDALGLDERTRNGALQGLSHAMHTVALVVLMCARDDLLTTVAARDGLAWETQAPGERAGALAARVDPAGAPAGPAPRVPLGEAGLNELPAIFLYDRYPGGVGFSERLFELHGELLTRTASLVRGCPCAAGCPSCVGPEETVSPRGKAAAIAILDALARTA